MKEFKLTEDLKILTNASDEELNKLNSLIELIICSNVIEASHSLDSLVSIDIGLGNLIIDLSSEEIRYLFVPSSNFQEKLKQTLQSNTNVLNTFLTEEVKNTILKYVKELLT